jgi:hypothetical protein
VLKESVPEKQTGGKVTDATMDETKTVETPETPIEEILDEQKSHQISEKFLPSTEASSTYIYREDIDDVTALEISADSATFAGDDVTIEKPTAQRKVEPVDANVEAKLDEVVVGSLSVGQPDVVSEYIKVEEASELLPPSTEKSAESIKPEAETALTNVEQEKEIASLYASDGHRFFLLIQAEEAERLFTEYQSMLHHSAQPIEILAESQTTAKPTELKKPAEVGKETEELTEKPVEVHAEVSDDELEDDWPGSPVDVQEAGELVKREYSVEFVDDEAFEDEQTMGADEVEDVKRDPSYTELEAGVEVSPTRHYTVDEPDDEDFETTCFDDDVLVEAKFSPRHPEPEKATEHQADEKSEVVAPSESISATEYTYVVESEGSSVDGTSLEAFPIEKETIAVMMDSVTEHQHAVEYENVQEKTDSRDSALLEAFVASDETKLTQLPASEWYLAEKPLDIADVHEPELGEFHNRIQGRLPSEVIEAPEDVLRPVVQKDMVSEANADEMLITASEVDLEDSAPKLSVSSVGDEMIVQQPKKIEEVYAVVDASAHEIQILGTEIEGLDGTEKELMFTSSQESGFMEQPKLPGSSQVSKHETDAVTAVSETSVKEMKVETKESILEDLDEENSRLLLSADEDVLFQPQASEEWSSTPIRPHAAEEDDIRARDKISLTSYELSEVEDAHTIDSLLTAELLDQALTASDEIFSQPTDEAMAVDVEIGFVEETIEFDEEEGKISLTSTKRQNRMSHGKSRACLSRGIRNIPSTRGIRFLQCKRKRMKFYYLKPLKLCPM